MNILFFFQSQLKEPPHPLQNSWTFLCFKSDLPQNNQPMVHNYFQHLVSSQQHVAQDLSVEKYGVLIISKPTASNWTSWQQVLNSQQMLLLSSRKANTPLSSRVLSKLELGLCPQAQPQRLTLSHLWLELHEGSREFWTHWDMEKLNEQQSRPWNRKFSSVLGIFW